MESPKVTVLMSIYNGERYLCEAIDSILGQGFEDFEFLIVNDGSSDRTDEILESYQDNRIKIINNDRNMGLTRSLNKGLEIARGKYIARMDADDISAPGRLEEEVKFLDKDSKTGLVGSWHEIIDENNRVIGTCQGAVSDAEIKRELMETHPFCHSSVMFKKECIDKIGPYREEFRFAQDYDLWLRISEKYKVANIPAFLCQWRVNLNSLTIQNKREQIQYAELAKELAMERKRQNKDRLEISEKRGEIVNYINSFKTKNDISNWARKREMAKVYQGYGLGNLIQRDKKKARYLFFLSIRYAPYDVRAYVYLFLTLLPFSIVKNLRSLKIKLI